MLQEYVFIPIQPVSFTGEYNMSQENGDYVFVGDMLCILHKTIFLDAWCLANLLICVSFEQRFEETNTAKFGLYFLSENTHFDKEQILR